MFIRRCELIPVFAVCAVLTGCGAVESYPAIALTDRRLAEFGDMHSIDREKLGLPPLPSTAKVEVERPTRAGAPYDAMLHVYARQQSRTIAFRRRGEELKWVHEQVTVYG